MIKKRTMLVGLLLVLMTMGFSLNAVAQDNSEDEVEIPEILQPNPSLDFEREAIKEWVEDHSWEEAFELARKAHIRVKGEENSPRGKRIWLFTPLLTWVEANYKGEQRFWSKEKIQEDYQSKLNKPNESAYFLCQFMTPEKPGLDMENFIFVLEDEKEKRWKAKETGNVELRSRRSKTFLGTTVYIGVIDLTFNFPEDKKPSWDELTLYVVRTDLIKRVEFTWDFE